jgi:hypothetical protein
VASAPTLRERFHAVMNYEPTDQIPNFEFGYWSETLPAWHHQGLPPEMDNEAKVYEYFGIEDWGGVPANTGLLPGFEHQVLEETETYRTIIDGGGVKCMVYKDGTSSIPRYLEFPVHDRESWERVKRERLNPDRPDRLPQDWLERVRKGQEAGVPIALPLGSMYGVPRNLMGFEGISMMLFDDYDLVDDVVETHCQIVERILDRITPHFRADFGAGWEDICFRGGPIISPDMFRKLAVPRYQRLTERMRANGIKMIWTDCDGDITPLVPCFLEGGVNCMFPVEVHAGSDPVNLRRKFGQQLLLVGGVDKFVLRETPKDIRKELKRIQPIVKEGGFIPTVDHRVPPDVPLENYKAYLRMKRDLFGVGGRTENL